MDHGFEEKQNMSIHTRQLLKKVSTNLGERQKGKEKKKTHTHITCMDTITHQNITNIISLPLSSKVSINRN